METTMEKKLTTRARSPSSSLMTAEKLLEVMSRNPQHLLIDCLSHPEVGCSWMADKSRFDSWKSLNWRRVWKSAGRVKRSLSRLVDELILFLFLFPGGGGWGRSTEGLNEWRDSSRTTSFRRRVDHLSQASKLVSLAKKKCRTSSSIHRYESNQPLQKRTRQNLLKLAFLSSWTTTRRDTSRPGRRETARLSLSFRNSPTL